MNIHFVKVFAFAYVLTFTTFWLGMSMFWHHERAREAEGWPEHSRGLRLFVSNALAAAHVLAVLCGIVTVVVIVRFVWTAL